MAASARPLDIILRQGWAESYQPVRPPLKGVRRLLGKLLSHPSIDRDWIALAVAVHDLPFTRLIECQKAAGAQGTVLECSTPLSRSSGTERRQQPSKLACQALLVGEDVLDPRARPAAVCHGVAKAAQDIEVITGYA